MSKPKLGVMEIKAALHDERFRELFPEYEQDMHKFLNNTGCACNAGLYRKIMSHRDRLQKYFPTKDVEVQEEPTNNRWKAINCKRTQLEAELRKLPKGRKQIAVAIDGEEATVVVNELD